MQTQFFFATQCCFYIQEIVLSWCSKSSLPEVGFLILLLPEYGSLIDTTIADRYRCRLFIKSAYTIGGKKDNSNAAGWVFSVLLAQIHANFTSSVSCRSIRSYVYWTSHRL